MAVKVLGIAGSLRKDSFNRMALRAAAELVPDGMTIDIYEGIGDFPQYNDDLRTGEGYPPIVADFRQRIADADAILFVTPEYNYSIPGVLKNAIDWASREPDQPFNDKPCAIMGAAPGIMGSVRAQYHLRQACVFLNMHAVNKPDVIISQARGKFDESGKLTDEATAGFIKQLMQNLNDWTIRLRGGK